MRYSSLEELIRSINEHAELVVVITQIKKSKLKNKKKSLSEMRL